MGKVRCNKKCRILAIAAVTFFSLCANVLATVAWFTANRSADNENDYFAVQESGNATIESVSIYKFNYGTTVFNEGTPQEFTTVDYLSPETGVVKKYDFNETEQAFGETIDDVFYEVPVMNIYDPLDKIIQQNSFDLFTMNCNVVYEITFASTSFTTCDLSVVSNRFTKTPGEHQILLSDCVDFDVFYRSDLNSASLANKAYYPSYKEKDPEKTDAQELTALEMLYYKFSYLSKLKGANNHANFYSTNPKPSSITLESDHSITFVDGKFTLYINANYAPTQLERYSQDIYLNNILAIYDFNFSTMFKEAEE